MPPTKLRDIRNNLNALTAIAFFQFSAMWHHFGDEFFRWAWFGLGCASVFLMFIQWREP